MDLTTTLIAVASFLVGLLAGTLLTKTIAPQEKKRRELEDKLRRTEDAYKHYQQDVTEHFIQTSAILRDMSQSYRNLGEHLASGAMTLSTTEVSRQVLEASLPQTSEAAPRGRLFSSINAEPPKDYAPSVPGGVLSENYGFAQETDASTGTVTRGLKSAPTLDNTDRDASYADSENDDDDPTLKVG